jgi:hypothetical protein
LKDNLDATCRRLHSRSKQTTSAPDYTALPVNARPTNRLSNRAVFANCTIRRRGYIAYVQAEQLALLLGAELNKADRQRLENDWIRGKVWLPPLVRATYSMSGWTVDSVSDGAVATFVAEKNPKQYLPIQVLEQQDVPATEEKLTALRNRIEFKQRSCAPLFARITY